MDPFQFTDKRNFAYYNRKAVRAAKRAKKARLIKDIFWGYNLDRSEFLAFDPFHDFQITPYYISPKNRMNRLVGSSGYTRKRMSSRRTIVHSMELYVSGLGQYSRRPFVITADSSVPMNSNLNSQEVIKGFTHDTSKKTRGIADLGEMEMFHPKVYSPLHSYSFIDTETEIGGADQWGPYHRTDRRVTTTSGRTARITQTTVDSYLNMERAHFLEQAPSTAESLLPRAVPSSRSFSLLRDIAELKDIPKLLQTATSAVRDLSVNGTFDVSSNYLSKEFGWDPLVKSVLGVMTLPDKIAGRVNWLLRRAGKNQTFRAKRNYTSLNPSPVGFTFDNLLDEVPTSLSHVAVHKREWRLALNYGIRFPELELPKLKSLLTSQLWGLRFRPDDFYNLVPWSWLIDWFGGLGDYIEAICAVSDDTSLANYGFLTYVSDTHVISGSQGYFPTVRSTRFNSGPLVTENKRVPSNKNAALTYKYQCRVDVTNLADIARTWVFAELNEFQASILGALAFRR